MASPRASAGTTSARTPQPIVEDSKDIFYANRSVFVKMQLLKPKDAFVSRKQMTLNVGNSY